jgi:hypothetical protein
MSDTVNQVIQTLESIASDIRDAKQALKSNNVTPESNSTSTLATEINKVPTGIKKSKVLEGFNNGKNTLFGGFIYNTDSEELNSVNSVLLATDEYVIPAGKTINIDFPSAEVTDDLYRTKGNANLVIKTAEPVTNIYNTILKPLYKTYIGKKCISQEITTVYTTDIHLDKSNMSGDTLDVDEFVFPNFNTKLYYKKDGEEQDTLITKINANKFHFSLSNKGRNIDLTCRELVIDLDSVLYFTEIAGHNGYESADETYYSFRDESNAHIIKLPEFNVSYSGITSNYDGLAEFVYLDRPGESIMVATNVQIRTEDDFVNIAKLNEDANLGGILRLFEIYNMDGTKKYDPKTKTFVDASTYLDFEQSLKLIKDRNAYFGGRNIMGVLNSRPINYKEYTDKLKKSKKDALAKLTIKPGYAYFGDLVPISGDLFKFDDYNQPAVFEEFPMLHVDEDVIKFNRNSRPEGSGKIIGAEEVKFRFTDIIDDSVRYNLPLLGICAGNPYGNPVTYHGITLQLDGSGYDKNQDGVTYKPVANAANLIASPYDTKFLNTSGLDLEYIYTSKAPLVYNKNIKRVLITSDSDRKGELELLLGYGLIYLVVDPAYDKPEVPSTPMKFIIDNETTIHNAKSKLYNTTVNSYEFVLGPASTDELAKYYDKYVHVLCPEDHPGLGTYEFCKYRIPLYNLDETKKYNYSKKTWEPVGSTTNDNLALEEIYPTEYAEESSRHSVAVYTNPGYELNAI